MTIRNPIPSSRWLPLLLILFSWLPIPAFALNIIGLNLPEEIHIAPNQTLTLNGVGVRTKFIYDIYIAALYLEQPSTDSEDILSATGAKRIALHFIYDEVSVEKLLEGWDDGFRMNNNAQQLQGLQQRLDQSRNLFQTVRAGDTIYIDYLPGQGTRVTINAQVRGYIPGEDFYQAALKVWLGEHPAQQTLKQGMLGEQETYR